MIKEENDIQAFHFEHKVWMNEIKFWSDEIDFFEHRLEELTKKYTQRQVMVDLERFQNQFIRHTEVLDELKHDIRRHERTIANYAKSGAPKNKEMEEFHLHLKDRMNSFRKLYGELKDRFHEYMTKWM